MFCKWVKKAAFKSSLAHTMLANIPRSRGSKLTWLYRFARGGQQLPRLWAGSSGVEMRSLCSGRSGFPGALPHPFGWLGSGSLAGSPTPML